MRYIVFLGLFLMNMPAYAFGNLGLLSAGGGASVGQVFNIMSYGAVCDGVTNDTSAINAAFTAAAASAAYQNSTKISIVGPADGAHKGCVINSINGTGFTLGTGANTRPMVEISNMTLLCTGAGSICLDFTGSRLIKVHDVAIRGNNTAGQIPEICIQIGSADSVTSAAWHMFERVNCNNAFAFTALYNMGSENVGHVGNMWVNFNTANGPIGSLGTITGGSGCTAGANTVSLGGGSGSGATASVTASGGVVTSATILYEGRDYQPSDTLTIPAPGCTGASVQIGSVAPFAVVLDGQNHWRMASAFTSVTAPVDAWVSLTLLTFFGDNIRAQTSGAAVWMGWTSGVRMVGNYVLNQGSGANSACIALFDNGVTKAGITAPNGALNIELNCEGAASYSVIQTGSKTAPIWYSGRWRISNAATATAQFGIASNITTVTAQNVDWSFTFPPTLPTFSSAKSWTVTGRVDTTSPLNWNAPASFAGSVAFGSLAGNIGPVDIMGNAALAVSCARLINQSYTGALCNFQRASDSATVDIYPNANGNLDPNAFTQFCNGTTCKLRVLYDQSGNGVTCQQTTAANQPTFTLQLAALGNRPAFTFGDAGALAISCTATAAINNVWNAGGYISLVANTTVTTTATDRIATKTQWSFVTPVGGVNGMRFITTTTPGGGDWTASSSISGSYIDDIRYDGSNTANTPIFASNGTIRSNTSSTQPGGAPPNDDSGANLIIGNTAVTGGVNGYPGSIAEFIIWKIIPSATQLGAIRRNQAAYYGLGSAVN